MEKFNLFLLRGLMREAEHWGDFTPVLKQTFPQANIFCLDIPGNGMYNHLPTPTTIPKIVEHVRQDFLNIVRSDAYKQLPNYITAVSLGGMLTYEWITKNPHDFKKAVLINSSLKGVNPLFKRLLPTNFGTFLKVANTKNVEEKEHMILSLVLNNKNHFDHILKDWIRIQKKRPVSNYNALRQIFAAATYTPAQDKPKIPVLIINGAMDRLVSPDCSVQIANKWNFPIVTHPTAGHDLSGDDPEWLARELAKWF